MTKKFVEREQIKQKLVKERNNVSSIPLWVIIVHRDLRRNERVET